MPSCLICGALITKPSRKRGEGQRYCSRKCKDKMTNIARTRGALAYHLIYAHRVERSKSKQLGLWNELCRLVIRWREEDGDRQTYKPPEMALADIVAMDRPPTTNLYVRPKP